MRNKFHNTSYGKTREDYYYLTLMTYRELITFVLSWVC